MAKQEKSETSNVIPVFGNPLPGEPCQEVIDLAKDTLARAESGQITGLAVATTGLQDTASSAWACRGEGVKWALAGAVMMLQHRYIDPLWRD